MGALTWVPWAAALLLPVPAAAQSVDRWSGYIGEASARFAVPEVWIRRVMQAESGGRIRLAGRPITSRAGAMGLMQLMPGTWREMRLAHGLGANPYDPRDNILAGAAYLRAMYDRFGYPGAFAAYNAGPTRLTEHRATGRTLPLETISYVAKVAGSAAPPPVELREAAPVDSLFVARRSAPSLEGDEETARVPPASASLFVRLSAGTRR